MDNWIAYVFITIAFVIIVGNFSTFQKNTNQRMRKKNLNDLDETLPRSNKTDHKMPTVDKNKLKKKHLLPK
ncbi:hypothetical protein [Candidatus Colwellia aromaticivorans]|uniref:hypothetical protein n=1 Tax=Candidatus Colwellia aromaticivorans TaxID=2267621 RepID=UPI000DF20697|nr:hypothetical protein [Candidatus Colwellia aromaticivorans]